MSRVAVNSEVLRWAFHRSGRTADRLQRKFPKIREWETGETQLTLRELESLAKATLTPLGYFFLPKPPEDRLPVPFLRTLGDEAIITPSPDLLETIQMMQRRQEWMREFLIDEGQDRLAFVASAKIGNDPQEIANIMRKVLGFDEQWAAHQPTWTWALRTLREAMESAGILVVVNGVVGNNTHRKLRPEEFRGFVLVDHYAPLVFVNGADGKAAQMFTLAHELAHVFFGSSAAFDLRDLQPASNPIEQACNQIAAEFLVPEQQLRQIWHTARHELEPFQTIAQKFKVSTLVAARRTLDLALIQKSEFLDFYRNYQREEHQIVGQQPGGGNFYLNQNLRVGRRFARAVVQAAKEGKLLYSEAYKLTGLYGKAFDSYADSLRIGGGL